MKVSGRSIRLGGHCFATQCENEKCRIGRKMGEQKPASSKGLETVAGQTGWTTKTRCDYYYYYYYSCDVLQSRKFRLRRDARILFSSLISRLPPCLFFFFIFESPREREYEYNHPRDTREIESWGNMVADGRWRNERELRSSRTRREKSKEFEKLKKRTVHTLNIASLGT